MQVFRNEDFERLFLSFQIGRQNNGTTESHVVTFDWLIETTLARLQCTQIFSLLSPHCVCVEPMTRVVIWPTHVTSTGLQPGRLTRTNNCYLRV